MTLIVVLMLGAGAVLIVSAIETDPATGKSVSVLGALKDIWGGQVDFSQRAMTSAGTGMPPQGNGVGGPGGINDGTVTALSYNPSAASAYRDAQVRAYIRSQGTL